jgi:hypothetical protein
MEMTDRVPPRPDGAAAQLAAAVSRMLDRGFGVLATSCLIAMITIVGSGVVAR